MIKYTQHPQFDFDILVDLYADGASSFQLSITKVERRLWGDECIAKIEGYVTVDAPIFASYLHRQVHSSILSKIDDVRPTSIVTTRRI